MAPLVDLWRVREVGVARGPRRSKGWVTERREVVAWAREMIRGARAGPADAGCRLQRGADRVRRAVGAEHVRGRGEESVVEFKRDLCHLPSLECRRACGARTQRN